MSTEVQVYWYNTSNQSTTKPQRKRFKNFIKSHIFINLNKINIKYVNFDQLKPSKKPDILIIRDKSGEFWYKFKDISKRFNLKHNIPTRFLTVYSPTPRNFLKKDTMFISESGIKYMLRERPDVRLFTLDSSYGTFVDRIYHL
jgi:hypothetical protein